MPQQKVNFDLSLCLRIIILLICLLISIYQNTFYLMQNFVKCCFFCFWPNEDNQDENRQENPVKQPQDRKQKQSFHLGLPNLGLTCHLNTALQLLFSMVNLRNRIIQNSTQKNKKNWFWNRHLGHLFKAMNENHPDKQKLLQKLIIHIEEEKPEIKIKQQNDLINIFSILLYELRQQDKGISDYFMLLARKNCGCKLDLEYFETYINPRQTCGRCKEQIKIEPISDSPPYLTCVTNESQRTFLDQLSLKSKEKKVWNYEVICFGNYIGDGRTGHYTCCLKRQREWIEISDNNCTKLSKGQQKTKAHRILVLERKEL